MTDFLTEFQDKMNNAGFTPKGGKVIADDKWHQAACDGDKCHKYSGTYTMKIVDGTFAIGCFFSRKDPDSKIKWHSNSGEKIDAAERKRRKKMIDDAAKLKAKAEERRQKRLADRLGRVFARLPMANEQHPYLVKKGIKAHGARQRTKGGELVIPLRSPDGNIWTLQRITGAGSKYLFPNGRKQGNYFTFGQITLPVSKIFICEGYSTGASIYEATGIVTCAAIDSGNMKYVAEAIKKKYPKAQIIFCADNDFFTFKPNGDPWNVGIEKANEAAGHVGGAFVTYPDFSAIPVENYNATKPTDYNDLHNAIGLRAVAYQIKEFVDKIPAVSVQQEEPPSDALHSLYEDQPSDGGDYFDALPLPDEVREAKSKPVRGDFDMHFRVLGYNDGHYYYFPFGERQIVKLSASAHSLPNLFRLDSLDAWMSKFGSTETSEKRVVMYATNALMELSKRRGVFEEKDYVRGSGAWLDKGRKILHCGDALYVDGVQTPFDQMNSDYTYIASSRVTRPAANALSGTEAYALRQICEAVTWDNKLSGGLLAGWLVIAPICGALSYRPHVFIFGEAESGKSTVMDRIVKPAIGNISVNLDGRSTEPKIREIIGYGARPVIFDEAEKSQNIEAVIDLARSSTDGKHVGKFGQKIFKALSAFCFGAVNPPITKVTDESRITFMMIRKNKRATAIDEYNALLDMIERTLTPEYSARMLARTMENFDALLDNIKTFERAARRVISGARASQGIGAMLGGLYLLSKTDRITPEAAEEWIRRYDWGNHTMIKKETDPVRLVQYISGCFLKLQSGTSTREMSIGDLILMKHKEGDSSAGKLLNYNGINVKDGRVYIASYCQHLAKLLRDTDWSAKWCPMLENIDGAEKVSTHYFRTGLKTSGVSLPVGAFVGTEADAQPKLNFDMPPDIREIPF